MTQQFNYLKFKITSKKKIKTHIVLNRILRTSYNNFIQLKAQKALEQRRLFAILLATPVLRAKMKKRGGTREERNRRAIRKVLVAGMIPMHDNFQLKARALFKDFMMASADRYEKLRSMQVFSAKIIRVQTAFRRRQSSKSTKRALLNDLWDRFV